MNGQSVSCDMPKGAKILSVQMQHGNPTIWAMVDIDAEKETRIFTAIGTGWEIADSDCDGEFIGTVQSGALVWHIFEIKQKAA